MKTLDHTVLGVLARRRISVLQLYIPLMFKAIVALGASSSSQCDKVSFLRFAA